MHACLDDLVIASYVTIDDFLADRHRPRRGRPPQISDAEIITLAIAAMLLDTTSERAWSWLVDDRLGHLFPYVPDQPGYNKRLRALARTICAVLRYLARCCPSFYDRVRLLDWTPVPCGASRQTVRRSELAGYGGYGRLRLVRQPLPLVVGLPAVPAVDP